MSVLFSRLIAPLPCAVLLTLANAWKPLVIDDTAYIMVARQILATPDLPYGMPPRGDSVIWYQHEQGAFTLLTPPVLPYWIAAEIAVCGENPIFWKLGLFPFCWLFTAGLFALFRRFARGWERRLLLLTVCSPTFLPSLNLMLDVPALGLALAAIALFINAVDRRRVSWRLLLLSGLLAGIGMQTKYTAATAPAAMLWFGLLYRRFGAASLSAGVAIALFAGWETYVSTQYGQSHFLYHLARRYGPPPPVKPGEELLPPVPEPYPFSLRMRDKQRLVAPLFGYLGGLGIAVALLLWLSLGATRRVITSTVILAGVGFVAVALTPLKWSVFIESDDGATERLSLNGIVVGIEGAAFLLGSLVALAVTGFRRGGRVRRSARGWFLAGWLLLELGGYFAMSPFGAARRFMGIIVAATLLAGFLLRTRRNQGQTATHVVILGVGLGIAMWLTDFAEARVEKQAAQESAAWIRNLRQENEAIWFTGHWGFRFYAEAEGMHVVLPERSRLRAGDWLVVPDDALRPYAQRIRLAPELLEARWRGEWLHAIPLRTVAEYYAGTTPFRRHEGPRVRVTIYRIRTDFLARTP